MTQEHIQKRIENLGSHPLPPLLLRGDCLEELARIPDASVDAVVTDPPYGLEFMGKDWDSFKGDAWRNSAGITRTGYTDGGNRVARPSYGGGDSANPTCATCGGRKRGAKKCSCAVPEWRVKGKPLDQRDNNAAQMRSFQEWCGLWAAECYRVLKPGGHLLAFGGSRTWHRLAAGIEDAGFEIRDSIAWLYGTGFPKSLDVSKAIDKAAGAEREVIAPPPYARGRAKQSYSATRRVSYDYDPLPITAPSTGEARTWSGWGTALKPAFEPVVVARKPLAGTVAANVLAHGTGALNIDATRLATKSDGPGTTPTAVDGGKRTAMAGDMDRIDYDGSKGRWPTNVVLDESQAAELDASRFFYVAKAPKSERPVVDGTAHPTVKPLALMRWLLRLVTPPGGCIVDPFAGSGTTLEAAHLEGFESIGCEFTPEYWPLIEARIARVTEQDGEPIAIIYQEEES